LTQQLETQQLKEELHGMFDESAFGMINSVDLRMPDGSIKTVKMSITKVLDQGQPYGYLIVLTDLTTITQATLMIERQVAAQTQAVRETKAQLLSSINSLSFGFLLIDNRPEVVMVNNVAHKLFCGSREHDASICPLVTMRHLEKEYIVDVPLMNALRNCLEKQEPQRIKSAVFNHRTWRIFISPMIDGDRTTGAVLIIQDITEEQILARSRDEFFSIASHELRTPLTAIKGNSSLMMQYYADALKDPSLREMVDDIHESSERLITIVNDFLDVSRLEQGRVTYQFEEVSVVKTIEKVVYEMSATVKQAGIYLHIGPGLKKYYDSVPNAIADQGRLKQILYNLIGNAAKFTEKGGVTIDATVSAHHIRVTVTDTGRGIPPEMQPLLFHKFQQAGESLLTRDSTKGTGLGLYISRLLARGMGGMLVLDESIPGKGSTFVLTLPVASAARLKRMQHAAENDKKPDAIG
jgi:signal transduction histidine kinase